MEGKPWWKSRTIWGGIITALLGAYATFRESAGQALGWNLPEVPPAIYTVLGAFGVYGRLNATTKIGG